MDRNSNRNSDAISETLLVSEEIFFLFFMVRFFKKYLQCHHRSNAAATAKSTTSRPTIGEKTKKPPMPNSAAKSDKKS